MAGERIPCVGAVVTDSGGRLLLVKRGHEPEAGHWSLPGGRIEPGETDQQALVRELREETGLQVSPGRLVGVVERPGQGGSVLDVRDYAATVTGGRLIAGDDADAARWVSPQELRDLPLTSGLAETLAAWGVTGPPPERGREAAPPPALVAEATKRAGLIWLAIPGHQRPRAVWHVWHAGAAYLVTGPGEQSAPGLAEAGQVTVTVASGQTGGGLLSWNAGVSRVEPGSAEWDAVIGPLVAGRLNASLAPGERSPAQRWARSGAVYRLTPLAAGASSSVVPPVCSRIP